MENFVAKQSKQIEVLQFNEEQLAKVGAALQALANEISPTDEGSCKHESKEDIIELLSDSDTEEAINGSNDQYPNFTTNASGRQSEVQIIEDDDSSTTWSVHSENSDSQAKLQYDILFESAKVHNTVRTNSNHAIGTYVTLTDITAEKVKVEEVNAEHALSGVLNKKQDSLNTLTTENAPLEESDTHHIDAIVGSEELIVEPKLEIQLENPEMTSYNQMEMQLEAKTEASPSPAERYLSTISHSDSSEYNTAFGNDIIDCISDDSDLEFFDPQTNLTSINLVDSETEEEQETVNMPKPLEQEDISLSRKSVKSVSMDCFVKYNCPQCGLECATFSDWKLHTNSEHKFDTIEALNMQTIIDKAGKIRYQCRDCRQKFELHIPFSRLLPHRISHLPHESYVHCRMCDTSFRHRPAVREHLFKSHYKVCHEYLQQQRNPNIYALKFVRISCPICNEQFANRRQWKDHLEDIHDFIRNINSRVTFISNDIYVCEVCNHKLRKRSIMLHMLKHEKYKSFACTYCNNYEAAAIMSALNHVRRVHLNEDTKVVLKCQYCEATFTKAYQRLNHIHTNHKVKPPKCAICDKEFFSISLLLSHMNFANHHKLK